MMLGHTILQNSRCHMSKRVHLATISSSGIYLTMMYCPLELHAVSMKRMDHERGRVETYPVSLLRRGVIARLPQCCWRTFSQVSSTVSIIIHPLRYNK